MPQPPQYARSYDFTVDAGNRTNHSALNAEYDAIQQTLDAIINNLALIQNDQGGPQRGFIQAILDTSFCIEVRNANGAIIRVPIALR